MMMTSILGPPFRFRWRTGPTTSAKAVVRGARPMATSCLLLLPAGALLHRPSLVAGTAARRGAVCACAEADDLEKSFAAELARRQQSEGAGSAAPDGAKPAPEPFTGIREIVIDEQGNAKAVEKRPPPPPGGGIAVDIGMLIRSPAFLFGTVLSVGSLVLLLLISAADEAS